MQEYVTHHDKIVEFGTGAKRSDTSGKGRFDLISPIALRRLARVYERGASQKGDRNWEGGFPISRALDSALRHINQYREGYRDEDHLAQAAWNLFAAIHFEDVRPEFNDLPSYMEQMYPLMYSNGTVSVPVYDIDSCQVQELTWPKDQIPLTDEAKAAILRSA